jgi:hypothetical protein
MCDTPPPPFIILQVDLVHHFINSPSITTDHCIELIVFLQLPLVQLYSSEVEVNVRPTVSRPVCPCVRRPSGTCDQFLLLCYFVSPFLTRGRVCNLLLLLPLVVMLGRTEQKSQFLSIVA